MQACNDDLAGLIRLQQVDLDVMRQKKQLDELPQRELILKARKKREAVEDKRAKVEALKKDASQRLSRLNDEDASLAKKEAGVQVAIDATHGDYRNVEARTKELAGIAKRREALVEQRAKIDAELEKIRDIEAQVARALDDIGAVEAKAVASFQQEGGALKASLAQLEGQRADVAATMAPEVLSLYEKTAARTGGVAVGVLSDNRCGACRTVIEGGRLIDLKSQAPLGVCPSCKRLLIIE